MARMRFAPRATSLGFLAVALLLGGCRLFEREKEPRVQKDTPVGESRPGTTEPNATVSADSAVQNGPVRVYFTTPSDPRRADNIAEKAAGYINQARESIDVAAYELDNRVVIDALVRAKERGVKVRLVTDSDYLEEAGPAELKAVGIPVVDDQRSALMHNKFLVLDREAVWTGSINFTENCAYKNDNHGIVLLGRDVAENYATKFEWMFHDRKFGGKPTPNSRIPSPKVTLADGTEVEVYFSTHDRLAERLATEVKAAKKSVHFLAFSFTHEAIADAMVAASERGAEVSGVFEKSQAAGRGSQFPRLKSTGLAVYRDANPKNMHHKFVVVDGAVVVAGSFNFSSSADKSNDENIVIIRNKTVAARFEAEFRRVREQASAVE